MLKSLTPVTRMSTLQKPHAHLGCNSLHDNSSVGQACVQIDCNLGLTNDPPVTKGLLLMTKKHNQYGKNCLLGHVIPPSSKQSQKSVHKGCQGSKSNSIADSIKCEYTSSYMTHRLHAHMVQQV